MNNRQLSIAVFTYFHHVYSGPDIAMLDTLDIELILTTAENILQEESAS